MDPAPGLPVRRPILDSRVWAPLRKEIGGCDCSRVVVVDVAGVGGIGGRSTKVGFGSGSGV